jgi:hypothetical protein
MLPVELVMIGIIATIFSVIFIFLHIELSTRKKRLVQKVETTLKDLPSKLSERSLDEDPIAKAIHEYFHTEGTIEDFKVLQKKLEFENLSDKFAEKHARTLMKKIKKLKELSIGELENLLTIIEAYHSQLPEKISINRVLSRVNDMLEPFVANDHESEGVDKGANESKQMEFGLDS